MEERITIDPKVCHGQACIKGKRIPVRLILGMLANGDTIEDLLAEYPSHAGGHLGVLRLCGFLGG